MRKLLIALCLLAVPATAVEVRQKDSDMDDQALSADSLLGAADELFKVNDMTGAAEAYQNTLDRARSEFNRSVETEALAQLARVYLKKGEREAGEQYLAEAAQKAATSDPAGWSRYLGVKGRFEWLGNDLPSARTSFFEMYEYCAANALYGRCIDAANMMGIVSDSVDEQLEWYRRGIEMAEKSEIEDMLPQLWNNLAATYYDHKQFDSALTGFEKAREYHWRYSGEVQKLFADYQVGMSLRMVGKIDEAEQWLRPVVAWAERIGNHSALGQALQDLGEIAVTRGKKADGLKLLKRARDEYKAAGFDTGWKEVWDGLNKRISELE